MSLWIPFALSLVVSFSESKVLVKIGESVTLPCHVAYVSDPLKMYWKFSSKNSSRTLMESALHSNITEGHFNLTVSPVTFSDEGTYACYAQGANGTAECLETHSLYVSGFAEAAQKKYGDPLYFSRYNHTELILQFSPEGSGEHLNVCTVEGDVVECSSEFESRITVEGDCLVLKELTPADSGQYVLSDFSGNNISIVALTVEASKQEHVEPAGSTMTISVPTRGKAVLLFHPRVFREPLQLCSVQDSKGSCRSDDSISVTGGELKIRHLTPQNHGRYIVILEDRNIIFSDISVVVKGHTESVNLQPGAILSINFYTHTAVVVLFTPSSNQQSSRVIVNDTEISVENLTLHRGYFILRGVSPSHQGTYFIRDLSSEHLYNTVDVTVSESINHFTDIGMPYFEKRTARTTSESSESELLYVTAGATALVILIIGIIGFAIWYRRSEKKMYSRTNTDPTH